MTTKTISPTEPPTTTTPTTRGGETAVKVGKITLLKRAWAEPRTRWNAGINLTIYLFGLSLGASTAGVLAITIGTGILFFAAITLFLGFAVSKAAESYKKKHQAAGTWPRNPLLREGETL